MVFKITVTKNDIKVGEAGSTCNCPVALVLMRRTGKNNFRVDPKAIYCVGERVCWLPKEANRFIRRFDALPWRRTIKPISFVVDIPQKFLN